MKMPPYKPLKTPSNDGRNTMPDKKQSVTTNLLALLAATPKRTEIRSRDIVATNKGDILKALRRGHRIEDIALALTIPIRTFIRRLKEQNISARSVRKQYRRSA
jgi:hypothetical protein